MNSYRTFIFKHLTRTQNRIEVLNTGSLRSYCQYTPRVALEKSVNHVTLLGRVGINPQLRGTESKPVAVFTLATNTNYRYESGEIQQKTDWHRISVFKPNLRTTVLDHLRKGARVYVEGRILYGEFTDTKGVIHNTTSIIASDIIFVGSAEKREEIDSETVEAV